MGFGPGGQRDSTRGHVNPHNEDALQRHYGTLKTYLASSLHDEKGNMKPNRARDKLLRLSVTQFMELSTDVFDELIRREDVRLQRVQNVPPSLPPKNNFHPKRNQARQKLSTLPLERFKQLATDVYFELERRIPRFAAGDMDRPMSGASTRSARGPPGMRGPPGPGGRPPMGPPGPGGFGPPPRAATAQGDFGRPLPKTFQSNTIVPNKSTMVEDDDEDDEDGYGALTGLSDRFSKNTNLGESSAEDKERIKSLESETTELKEKIEDLESKILEKEQELERVNSESLERQNSASGEHENERNEWLALREGLEEKHMDAQKLNENLRNELDQLHREKSQDEREIRSQHDRSLADMRAQIDNFHAQTDDLHKQLDLHRQENEDLRNQLEQGQQRTASSEEVERLREELATQEKISSEVRSEAHMYLQEMRDLSRQNDEAIEQEEKLAAQVQKMEREIDEWRQRYAKVKAQNKHLRASTMGLGLQSSFDAGSLMRKEALLSDNGLVKDVDVTRFQLAVDELLKVARQQSTEPMLDTVKNVVVCVQSITTTVGTDGYPTPAPSPLSPADGSNAAQPMSVGKLKARVTGTANSLITATKQHASASGLSPVALLDAAASNLTASVVELIKAVGIRPSSQSELQDLEEDMDAAAPSPIDVYANGNTTTGDPHMSLSSFYNDELSPTSDKPGVSISSPPLEPLSSPTVPEPLSMGGKAAEAVQKPPPLGRSNTMKKWFGWGSRNVEEEEVPPTPRANGGGGGEGEYDPYR